MTSSERKNRQTAKLLSFILGRHPDEFGLIPDDNGFIPVKTLLKALHEERDWRHIRFGHLKEIALTVSPCPIEIQDNLIRASDRHALPAMEKPEHLPKLLFTPVRSRAYPSIDAKGLKAGPGSPIVLSTDKTMAERIGKRKDPHPVILTVQTEKLIAGGASVMRFGMQLYVSDHVPVGSFTGPPLPKDLPQKQKPEKKPGEQTPSMPGSFFPDLEVFATEKKHRNSKRASDDKKAWQRDRRLARKHKSRNREH